MKLVSLSRKPTVRNVHGGVRKGSFVTQCDTHTPLSPHKYCMIALVNEFT